jgi:adenylate kinase family enzyme
MNKIIIITGSPASGKTTYGKRIARKRKALFLDIDTVTEILIRTALKESGRNENDRDSSYFKKTYRKPIYDTLFKIAVENILWTDVVIAGPFTKEVRIPDWPEILIKKFKVDIEIHYVYCSSVVRLERIRRRNELRDIPKLKEWETMNKYYGKEDRPVFQHIFVDTT